MARRRGPGLEYNQYSTRRAVDGHSALVGNWGGGDNKGNLNPDSRTVYSWDKTDNRYEAVGEVWSENGKETYHAYDAAQKKLVNDDHKTPGSTDVWPDKPVATS